MALPTLRLLLATLFHMLVLVMPLTALAQGNTGDNPLTYPEFDAAAAAAAQSEAATAELGDNTRADLAYFVGLHYEQGSRGASVEERINEAERAYRLAGSAGFPQAMMGMARIQMARLQNQIMGDRSGFDIERDLFYWVNRAADMGFPDALLSRAEILADGRFGQAQDHSKALQDLTTAAEQGEVQAQKLLGWALFQGTLGSTDYQAALDWSRRAAATGDQEAADMLQRMEQGLASSVAPDFLFIVAVGFCDSLLTIGDAAQMRDRFINDPRHPFVFDPAIGLPYAVSGTNRVLIGLQNQGLTFTCSVVVEGRADWFAEKVSFMLIDNWERQPDTTFEDGSVWQHHTNRFTDQELGTCRREWIFGSAANGLQHRFDYSWQCI